LRCLKWGSGKRKKILESCSIVSLILVRTRIMVGTRSTQQGSRETAVRQTPIQLPPAPPRLRHLRFPTLGSA
jgi:hypothetical protein